MYDSLFWAARREIPNLGTQAERQTGRYMFDSMACGFMQCDPFIKRTHGTTTATTTTTTTTTDHFHRKKCLSFDPSPANMLTSRHITRDRQQTQVQAANPGICM
ncbi:hypothetical protein EG329_010271 [Mollisiaceae sp. DMI_Dod_QoI]|nr:hypothetical protein EG329_010271 [Helotiales sp. DMI_Dod_QoI]